MLFILILVRLIIDLIDFPAFQIFREPSGTKLNVFKFSSEELNKFAMNFLENWLGWSNILKNYEGFFISFQRIRTPKYAGK